MASTRTLFSVRHPIFLHSLFGLPSTNVLHAFSLSATLAATPHMLPYVLRDDGCLVERLLGEWRALGPQYSLPSAFMLREAERKPPRRASGCPQGGLTHQLLVH